MSAEPAAVARPQPARAPRPAVRSQSRGRAARGESMLWLCGGALCLCLLMIGGLVGLIVVEGMSSLWPDPLVLLRLHDGHAWLGEPARSETFQPPREAIEALPESARGPAATALAAHGGKERRQLLRTGNFELTNEHFRWIADHEVAAAETPPWAIVVERQAWGRFYGFPKAFVRDGRAVAGEPAAVWSEFEREHGRARARFATIEDLRRNGIGRLSDREDEARLAVRAAELRRGPAAGGDAVAAAEAAYAAERDRCQQARKEIERRIQALEAENARCRLVLVTADGQEKALAPAEIVRAYAPNQLDFLGRLGVYLDRFGEFLGGYPRESNSEGGVWPAIFGTVLMTLLMSICVVPFGVLAALYMREYAKAGLVISAIRIAVNNLAGVPSIVFGVFGLGFFCYIVGGWIDGTFYPERLPNPTFGKGALVWASLTLALLTVPVVIVATEEALAAVPRSLREGSFACGASRWQTIQRIVLPKALPGLMTGAILAMARGAGEVAPLMLVGAVKLAPDLPLDGQWPCFHPSRSFMHLGFHIYDLGFQSQNSEASRPMVFTTTLLLILVVAILNVAAVALRSRLRARHVAAQF